MGQGHWCFKPKESSVPESLKQRGVLSTHLYSDGRCRDALYVDGGPSRGGSIGHVRMQGREVMKHAVEKIGDAIKKALEFHGLTPQDIDWFVPHQANVRIINAVAKHFCFTSGACCHNR